MNEIEKLRNLLNMTTKEFAEHFGIPYNTVRQWVKGERKCPEYVISMLQKLIECDTKGEQVEISDMLIFCNIVTNLRTGRSWRSFYGSEMLADSTLNFYINNTVEKYEIKRELYKRI